MFAIGFAVVGAVVGAIRHFPELVGMGAGFVALAALAARMGRDIDLNSSFGSDRQMTATDFVDTMTGVNGDPGWLLIFGGSGLLISTVIGGLHLLFSPAKNTESITAPYRCYEV